MADENKNTNQTKGLSLSNTNSILSAQDIDKLDNGENFKNPGLQQAIVESAQSLNPSIVDTVKTKKEDITDNDKLDVIKFSKDEEEDLLSKMKRRLSIASDYFAEQRTQAEEDMDFYKGKQWDVTEINARKDIPTTQANKIATPVNKIISAFQKDIPQVQFEQGNSKDDSDTVAVYNAIASKIQSECLTDGAYESVFKHGVITGESYLRLYIDYENKVSLNKVLKVKAIENINCVLVDPDFGPDFSNINYSFVVSKINKEEYDEKYNKDGEFGYPTNFKDLTSVSVVNNLNLNQEEEVVVLEYFYTEKEKEIVYLLDNGLFMRKSDYDALKKKPSIHTKGTRTFTKVHHIITDGERILEAKIFPGEIIPIFPFFASVVNSRDKKEIFGAVRRAKAPQKDYNYIRSTIIWLINNMPKFPWIAGRGQLSPTAKAALMAGNSQNIGLIEYDMFDSSGEKYDAPQQVSTSIDLQGLVTALQMAESDIQNSIGIFDTTLGNDGAVQEESGIARITKNNQAEENNFYLGKSFSRTLRYLGKAMLNIIPIIYNDDRIYDVKMKNGLVSKQVSPSDTNVNLLDNEWVIDVTVGAFGENQRKKEFENILGLIEAQPDLMSVVGDLLIQSSGLTNAEEISERMIASGFISAQALSGSADEKYSAIAALQQQAQESAAQVQSLTDNNALLTQQIEQDKINYANLVRELNEQRAEVLTLKNKESQNINDNVTKLVMKLADSDPRYIPEALKLFNIQMPQLQMLQSQNEQASQNIPDQYVIASVNDPITQQQQQQQQQGQQQQNQNADNNQQVDQNSNNEDNQDTDALNNLLNNMPSVGRQV